VPMKKNNVGHNAHWKKLEGTLLPGHPSVSAMSSDDGFAGEEIASSV